MRTSPATRPRATPSTEEEAYLCDAVSRYLRTPVTPQDIVWSYAGVRPLLDDGAIAGAGSNPRLRAGT